MSAWGPFDLTGKRAVVTGGAMGIGGGISEWFVRAGASVVIADLDSDTAKETAERLTAMGPGEAVAVHVDISQDDAGDQLVAAAVDHFGGIDILVNNAGIYPQVPMLQMEPALFDKVVQINLRGLAFASKAVGLKLAEQGTGGRIINIASIDAIHPSMVGLAAYDASKGGVRMFTKAFALEMAEYGVAVNAIAPGGITTPGTAKPLEGTGMTAEQQAEIMAQFAASIPMKRLGVPDDIGKVALFLASDAASYITGEILVVDGGKLIT